MSEQLEFFPNTKKCATCGEKKDVSEFSRIRAGTENRRGSCKQCERAKLKATHSYDLCVCGNQKRSISKKCSECRTTQQDGITEKKCSCCGDVLHVSAFSYRRKRGGLVPNSHCRKCLSLKARVRRESWCPTKKRLVRQRSHKVEQAKSAAYRRRLHVARFCRALGHDAHASRKLAELENRTKSCEICGRSSDVVGTLHIDHDHKTNAIRGFLCSACNTALGQLGDSVETLRAAIKYLRRKPRLATQNRSFCVG